MYIAKQYHSGQLNFIIRESYEDNGVFLHRDLMELGPDPGRYVRYPNGRSFYIDTAVEDCLGEKSWNYKYDEIETLFWPFVAPATRRRYESVRFRDYQPEPERATDIKHHLFDKRRMLFLKSASIDQRKIHSIKDKYFRLLNEKSRDEIEQHFILMECQLKPTEIKSYIFIIFDLQRHFHSLFAREMPQALNQDDIARYFLDDICLLNYDKQFWPGMKMDRFLQNYLQRYIIMLFDSEFERSTFMDDQEFARFHRRRYHRQHTRPVDEVYSEAGAIFGVPESELKKMTKRQLKKLFRSKAQELHPDKGGDHDAFVALSRVYDELVMRK